MPRETAERAIQIGFDYAAWAEDAGFDILGNGEVGMGNTTTATACIMAVLGLRDGSMVGTGAGLSPDRAAPQAQGYPGCFGGPQAGFR